jgi:hypothetical protein
MKKAATTWLSDHGCRGRHGVVAPADQRTAVHGALIHRVARALRVELELSNRETSSPIHRWGHAITASRTGCASLPI